MRVFSAMLFACALSTPQAFGYSIKVTESGKKLVEGTGHFRANFLDNEEDMRMVGEHDCARKTYGISSELKAKGLSSVIEVKPSYIIDWDYEDEDHSGSHRHVVQGVTCLAYLSVNGEGEILKRYREVFKKSHGDKLEDCTKKSKALVSDSNTFRVVKVLKKKKCSLTYIKFESN